MARTKQPARISARRIGPSAHSIWTIPEVVENILTHLPMLDLLLAQTVCSFWHDIIRKAPRLQEALFFKPQPLNGQSTQRTINPLLEKRFLAWFVPKSDAYLLTGKRYFQEHLPTAQYRLALLRRGASWRRMLTAQPPLRVWEEVHTCHAQGGDSLSVGSISIPDGVRMGLVFDRTELGIRRRTAQRFYMFSDGVLLRDPSEQEGDETPDKEQHDEVRKRVFGGKDHLTLVMRRVQTCTSHGHLIPDDQSIVSADCEDVEIDMKHVPRVGRRFSWFTDDGFDKFS